MHHICIFASGRGSNAEKIIAHCKKIPDISIALIVSNNKNAGVLDLAKKYSIPSLILSKKHWKNPEEYITNIQSYKISLIVLAGFLWLIPKSLIQAFPDRIINIHPALLPKYGGKGMYGSHVHKAVVQNQEKESGITIHFVNEKFDEGEHIFQSAVALEPTDTPEEVAAKVLELEHKHFPAIVVQVARQQKS